MNAYEIVMIVIASMTRLLKIIEVIHNLVKKSMRKATAYSHCAMASSDSFTDR